MAFDSGFANGTLLGISRNFMQASGMSFRPDARDNTAFLGSREFTQLSQAVSNIDSKVQEDNITALGAIGYESDMVLAVCQNTVGTVQITETEFNGNPVQRPRSFISVKGISAKSGTATGPSTSLYAPSVSSLASLAVILDTDALAVAKNYTYRLTRVRNSTGVTLAAGTAVVFVSNVSGLVNVAPSAGGSATERFIGILAEDILTTETGACYSGGAALVPRTEAVAASAANETNCFAAASGAMASSGTLRVGRWKHVGGAGTASILQLSYLA